MYCLIGFGWQAIPAVADDGGSSPAEVRAAVRRSVPYIEEQGTSWIEDKKCVSCHRVNNMVWSLAVARHKGIQVSDQLDQWIQWSVEQSLAKNDQDTVIGLGNKEGVAQLLLGVSGEVDSQAARQLAALLRDGQRADGSWPAGGQLPSQKRPKPETDTVSTMWLALALLDQPEDDTASPFIAKALDYVRQTTPGKSTEWYALRLLLAAKESDTQVREQIISELRKQQRDDGGWGWLVGEPSDALGTGLAVYALLQAGVDNRDAAVRRAQAFLVSTQRTDGSWPVNGTKAKKAERVEETAVYWGTTWATLALTSSLPAEAD